MGDAGEGLIDAQDDFQERQAERDRQRRSAAPGRPRLDPARERERKSLDLAKAELTRQAAAACHPVRRSQIETALAEVERRIASL